MLSRRLLRIKVVKALFAHLKSGADNMMASEKTLMASVDKAYDLYFQILTLPVELTRYAEQRQELAKQKKLPTYEDLNPNTKFVDNQVIRVIANSDAVNDHIAARKLGWGRHPELIRTLYTQLSESDYFKDYMLREERSFADDRKLLEDFFKELQSCEALETELEEMSILWSDDLPYIVMMILRSLSGLKPSHTELKVPAKFKSDEDPEFVKTLFEKSLVNYDAYQDYIEKFTANWDVERIVFMDNLIIGTAMAELTSFPSIPVKVTLDEYIEISKYYSTPGSSTFINGVLDKIVESLTAEGRIAGAGRDDGGMRHPAGTHGRDRAERPDYRRHGHDPRHGRHGYRAFRTHALGGGGRAQALDRKPGIEARSHHPIRPQLRVHDARI